MYIKYQIIVLALNHLSPAGYNSMNLFFSNTLKRLRSERGLSQQALADKMFVTRSTVARWENFRTPP